MITKIQYADFQQTDFFTFFNCKEDKKEPLKKSLTQLKLKTGGFQEFIDIELIINKKNEIEKGSLFLNRSWIGDSVNLNPFGKDIAKSFIYTLCPDDSKPIIVDLTNRIFLLLGTKDVYISIHSDNKPTEPPNEETKKVLQVYKNDLQSTLYHLSGSFFQFENINLDGKSYLVITWAIK